MCLAFKVLFANASADRERGEIHLTKATARCPFQQWAIVLRTICAMGRMAHARSRRPSVARTVRVLCPDRLTASGQEDAARRPETSPRRVVPDDNLLARSS